ncbi:hypothetical protein [Helicobacter bilis]|uniref:Uncharacterized protein n=2 Tax=Helicobacter bilis TaxID=37372 RepID=A0A6D2C8A7_9HELI|nr:hypothetical protein [Helicobacter bilis]EMZ37271.1 hypothetical protein C826_02133 [Helicobacter bilis WiWa]TLE03571.1 hypothetical protein LS77_008680 [Helicobacter bilis]TLE04303.1 hypothetical protein LS76_008710 [Helicobacter bilis]
MASLTDLIQDMIQANETTQQELQSTKQEFKVLKAEVDEKISDENILDIMHEQFIKDEYFTSESFYSDIGQALINKYGLGNLINLDRNQVNEAVKEYLAKNLDTKAVTEYIMQNYTGEIRDAMIRRIRIESKSILDNYDFSLQVLPRLEVLFKEFVKNYELTSYLMKSTAQLFVAQESNLAFMLEYIVAKELLHNP